MALDRSPAPASRNGSGPPERPRIHVHGAGASPDETAAIAAAIERFLRDTAPPPAGRGPPVRSAWRRAGLLEGTGLSATASALGAEPHPWVR